MMKTIITVECLVCLNHYDQSLLVSPNTFISAFPYSCGSCGNEDIKITFNMKEYRDMILGRY